MSETYNGYTNRETWATHQWISTDYDLHQDCKGLGAAQLQELIVYEYGCGVFPHVDEEIGDLSKVNWQEVADSLSEGK